MLAAAEWLLEKKVASRRLVDWVELGLVPAPRREGRALDGGRGSTSMWSPAGYLLWLNLLVSRELGFDIAALANAPVGLWIYTDTDWIEIAQVRRALRTWAARRSTYRAGDLTRNAAELVQRIKHPGTAPSARRRLRELLSRPDWDRQASSARLREAIRAVVAPGEAARASGPLSPSAIADHVTARLLERWAGLGALPGGPRDVARDALLLAARRVVREETDRHSRSKLVRELDRRLHAVNEPVGTHERIQVACLDLVTAFGHLRLEEMGIVGG